MTDKPNTLRKIVEKHILEAYEASSGIPPNRDFQKAAKGRANQILSTIYSYLEKELPEKRFPFSRNDRHTFIEPIIGESVNTPSIVEPFINKGYNQALRDVKYKLRSVLK